MCYFLSYFKRIENFFNAIKFCHPTIHIEEKTFYIKSQNFKVIQMNILYLVHIFIRIISQSGLWFLSFIQKRLKIG